MDDLELMGVEGIKKEVVGKCNTETIYRYFQNGIFFAHGRKDGVALQSYRGSVIVRYQSMRRLRQGPRRFTVKDLGSLFNDVSGPEDNFIVERLHQKANLSTIEKEFVQAVRDKLK